MKQATVNADTIAKLLEAKHASDVFVSECKNGPSVYGSHLRLDAWAMNRSWANNQITGYEIKVSRSDWTRDQKFHQYAHVCNLLYVVAPSGIVDPSELPEGVGLMVPSKNATRLYIKVKAAHREPDPEALIVLMQYILMSRASIHRPYPSLVRPTERPATLAYWEWWLETREMDYEFGQRVGGEISKALHQRNEQLHRENEGLKTRIESIAAWSEVLEAMGIDAEWKPDSYAGERTLEQIRTGLPDDLRRAIPNALRRIKSLAEDLQTTADGLERLKEGQ